MRLASVHTYPVKGCHRLDHDGAQVEPWGLAGDRRWLVVEPDGRALTQRDTALLTQIQPLPRPAGGLTLRAPGMPDLTVPQPDGAELIDVTVWRSTLPASVAVDAADEWVSRVLERKARLVWLDDPTRRPTDPGYSEPGDRVSFADGYPLLLINAASLDALNGWLLAADHDSSGRLAPGSAPLRPPAAGVEAPLPMTRFRPSVVISGAQPWAEDGWLGRRIRIGGVVFRAVKPCARCVVTTIDQETGEKGHEPLRVLAAHRNVDQGLIFGMNLIPDGTGPINVGDPVELLA